MRDEDVRALIVDDEIGALTLVGIMLERVGMTVFKARDASEALACVEGFQPNIVLLDVMMPGMNGIELCRVLREREVCRNIPILILSARGDAQSIMSMLDAGANDYLPKPILHHDLQAKVRHLLGIEMRIKTPTEIALVQLDAPQTSDEQTTTEEVIRLLTDTDVGIRGRAVVELAKRRRKEETLFRETPAQDAFWRNVYHSLASIAPEDQAQRWSEMAEVAFALTLSEADQNSALRAIVKGSFEIGVNSRAAALQALGLNGDADAVELFLSGTEDSEDRLCIAALEALGRLGDPRGVEKARAAASRSSIVVRYTAVNALAALGTEDALSTLRELLKQDDRMTRIDVIKAVVRPEAHIRREAAIEILLVAGEREQDNNVLYTLAIALSDLKSPEAIPFLQSLSQHQSDHVREGVEKALRTFNQLAE